MSITLYSCSACKRNIEIVDNSNALTLVNSCVITQFCKGNLSKVSTRPGNIVGNAPDLVDGLQDYSKTGRMFSYTQTLPSSSWSITHDLNSNPLTYVYVKSINNTYTQIDDDNYVVNVIDSNNISIQFADKIVGIAHVIARGNAQQPIESDFSTTTQSSANNILTIATPVTENDQSVLTFNLSVLSPTTNTQSTFAVDFTAHKYNQSIALFNTPWRDVQLLTCNNVLYRVRSVRIANILNANDIPDNSPFHFVDNPNIIMLISSPPYSNIADINNSILPITQLTGNYCIFKGSEVVVSTAEVVEYFPQTVVYKTIYQ